MKYFGLISIIVFMFLVFSCETDKAVDPETLNKRLDACDTMNVSFSTDIAPIIENNCAFTGCHGTPENSGFTMNNYSEISSKAQEPVFLAAIKHEGPNPMPRKQPNKPEANKLPDSTILKLECWIEAGTPDN